MHTAARSRVGGAEALVCGTGYTGEDGVELLLAPDARRRVWEALLAAGATPAGLGARDTLRLEVCFHLYGNDLDEDRNPIEAGLGWCCKEETGLHRLRGGRRGARARDRRAAGAVRAHRAAASRARATRCSPAASAAGEVTSGTLSPSLERGIGMAYVRADLAEPGTEVEIDVRGKRRPARIESKPLYRTKEG